MVLVSTYPIYLYLLGKLCVSYALIFLCSGGVRVLGFSDTYVLMVELCSTGLMQPDDNGEKHVLLCRVILGNVEKVEAGSKQCYPSSLEFDTGVDDPRTPKRYVVWSTNMNRHVLPECVVSYKAFDHVPGMYHCIFVCSGLC